MLRNAPCAQVSAGCVCIAVSLAGTGTCNTWHIFVFFVFVVLCFRGSYRLSPIKAFAFYLHLSPFSPLCVCASTSLSPSCLPLLLVVCSGVCRVSPSLLHISRLFFGVVVYISCVCVCGGEFLEKKREATFQQPARAVSPTFQGKYPTLRAHRRFLSASAPPLPLPILYLSCCKCFSACRSLVGVTL